MRTKERSLQWINLGPVPSHFIGSYEFFIFTWAFMEKSLTSHKESSGYYISGQGLVQMQSGKSIIWKSCLPAEFYSSLIFWSHSRQRQNESLALGSKRISPKGVPRQKCGPSSDKNWTPAPTNWGGIWSMPVLDSAPHFWLIFPASFPIPGHMAEAILRARCTMELRGIYTCRA